MFRSRNEIPARNIGVHEIHCQKYLARCPTCGLSVPKASLDKHEEEEHRKANCEFCDISMLEEHLAEHKVILLTRHLGVGVDVIDLDFIPSSTRIF